METIETIEPIREYAAAHREELLALFRQLCRIPAPSRSENARAAFCRAWLEKNGGRGGLHHMAIRVDNLEQALEELKAKGVRLIDEKPRRGAGGAMIAFLHPKATGGILLELCERK